MEAQIHRHNKVPCLNCGKGLDSASSVAPQDRPVEGDFTVCLYCGHLMIFTSDLSFRNLTEDEMYEIAGDPTLIGISHIKREFENLKKKEDSK
jgi:hypothetical protein